MKQNVQLYIFYDTVLEYNVISKEKNIKELLLKIFQDDIIIENNKIKFSFMRNHNTNYFIMLDSHYRLLSLKSKVPKKLLLICINADILNQIKRGYELDEDIIVLKDYLKSLYKDNNKENHNELNINKKISKETFDQIIKPALAKPSIKKQQPKKPPEVQLTIEKSKTKKVVANIPKKSRKSRKENKKATPQKKKEKKETNKRIIITSLKKAIPKKIKLIKKEIQKTKKELPKKKISANKQKDNKMQHLINSTPTQIRIVVKIQPNTNKVVALFQNTQEDKKTGKKIEEKSEESKTKVELNSSKKEKKAESVTNKSNINDTPKKEPKKQTIIEPEKKKEKGSQERKNEVSDTDHMQEDQLNATKKDMYSDYSVDTSYPTTQKQKSHEDQKKLQENLISELSDETQEINKEDQNEKEQQTISYTVLLPDNNVLYEQQVVCDKPMTVLDFLLQAGVNINQNGDFIESINGISNAGMSGWVFEVNNAPVMVPASKYIMNPSEQITWKYVDFSKMVQQENADTVSTGKSM